jgi:hypothetical protein
MKMNMPRAISTWFMILFFLFYGLSLFVAAIPAALIGLLALGAAVFLFIGR